MSIEEIIKELDKMARKHEVCVGSPSLKPLAETYRRAAKILRAAIEKLKTQPDNQPNEPKGGRWVNVEDRLPENGTDVLVWTVWHEQMTVLRGVYLNGEWWRKPGMFRFPGKITHWMPLPEPPKEETT